MNFSASSKFTGLNVSAFTGQINAATRLSVEQSAEVVLSEAAILVPIDTGELALSGRIEVESNTKASVIYDADHAAFLEYGTGVRGAASPGRGPYPYDPNWPGMPAQSYLRPALDTSQPAIREIFKTNMSTAVKLSGK